MGDAVGGSGGDDGCGGAFIFFHLLFPFFQL